MAIRFHANICSGGVNKDLVLMGFANYNLDAGGSVSSIKTNMGKAFPIMKKIAVDEADSLDAKAPNVGAFFNTGYKYMYVCTSSANFTSLVYRGYKLDGTYVEQIIPASTVNKTPIKIDISDVDIVMAAPYCGWTGTGTRFMTVKFSNKIYDIE